MASGSEVLMADRKYPKCENCVLDHTVGETFDDDGLSLEVIGAHWLVSQLQSVGVRLKLQDFEIDREGGEVLRKLNSFLSMITCGKCGSNKVVERTVPDQPLRP